MARTLAVVGAGVSGLAAARAAALRGMHVTVFEAADRAGGCLSRTDLGGFLPGGADDGAEAALNRRPEARDLIGDLALDPVFPSRRHGSRLVTPNGASPIPAGTLMGVPADAESLRGVLSDRGVERVAAETLTPPVDGDVSCGEFLAARLGDEFVDRVVDPLVGGVYAGRCRELSLEATIPALLPAARQGTSVLDTVRSVLRSRARTAGADIPGAGRTQSGTRAADEEPPPVFLSLAGGMNRIVPALVADLEARGASMRWREPVRAVAAGGLVQTEGGTEEFDSVVVALPAWAARSVLVEGDPQAAGGLGGLLDGIDYATSAVVTAVLRDRNAPLEGSGFLVPPALGGLVKASTFSSNKWPWMAEALPDDHRVVRVSVGRRGDEEWTGIDDEALVQRAFAEWQGLTGYDGDLLHAEVKRWVRALPQYGPGHAQRVAQIDAAASRLPGIHLAGSYLDGVGVPACIGRAALTVDRLTAA